jgi:hypothetical protein
MSNSSSQDLVDIIRHIYSKITNDTDVNYAGFDSPKELRAEIKNDLFELEKGNATILAKYNLWFAPTGKFGENVLSNGWEEEYLLLAEQFDLLYKKVKI